MIGNTGSNSTREAVRATCQGFAVGMHAALHINPYYGKTSRDGLIYHFQARPAARAPGVSTKRARSRVCLSSLYTGCAGLWAGDCVQRARPHGAGHPGRRGAGAGAWRVGCIQSRLSRCVCVLTGLAVLTLQAKHPNFAGVKECTGNDRIRNYTQRGVTCWSGTFDRLSFQFFSFWPASDSFLRTQARSQHAASWRAGNDDEAHDARWDAGAVGVISVTSNIVPGLMRQLMFDRRDPQLNARLQPLMAWLFAQPNPIGAFTRWAFTGCEHLQGRLC